MDKEDQKQIPTKEDQKQEKKTGSKYSTIAIVDLLVGIPLVFIQLLLLFSTSPFILKIFNNINFKPNFTITYILSVTLLALGVLNIYISLKLLFKSTKNKELYYKSGIVSLIIAFVLSGIFQTITTLTLIMPFYTASSNYENTSYNYTNTSIPTPTPTIPTPEELEKSNNNLDTSTWKTYTNKEYGFSFKYPNNWYQKENADFQKPKAILNALELKTTVSNSQSSLPGASYLSQEDCRADLLITNTDTEAIKLLKDDRYKSIGSLSAPARESEIIINDIAGIKRDYLPDNKANSLYASIVILPNKYNLFAFYFIKGNKNLNKSCEKTLDQILSTFKFTDQ